MQARKSWLTNGPFAERVPSGKFDQYRDSQGAIKIPLDEGLRLTDGDPFALAIYWRVPHGGGDVEDGPILPYYLHKIERVDGLPFQVQFVGGPLDGNRSFHQPAHVVPVAFVPLPSEPHSGEGRLKVFAQYNSAGDEFHFVQIHRQVTTELRVIYDLSGGAFDGHVFDSDAMDSDRDGAFMARGLYMANGCEVGKCFPLTAPHTRKQLEELGLDMPQYSMHKYKITESVQGDCEVLIRAEFVGPYPDRK